MEAIAGRDIAFYSCRNPRLKSLASTTPCQLMFDAKIRKVFVVPTITLDQF